MTDVKKFDGFFGKAEEERKVALEKYFKDKKNEQDKIKGKDNGRDIQPSILSQVYEDLISCVQKTNSVDTVIADIVSGKIYRHKEGLLGKEVKISSKKYIITSNGNLESESVTILNINNKSLKDVLSSDIQELIALNKQIQEEAIEKEKQQRLAEQQRLVEQQKLAAEQERLAKFSSMQQASAQRPNSAGTLSEHVTFKYDNQANHIEHYNTMNVIEIQGRAYTNIEIGPKDAIDFLNDAKVDHDTKRKIAIAKFGRYANLETGIPDVLNNRYKIYFSDVKDADTKNMMLEIAAKQLVYQHTSYEELLNSDIYKGIIRFDESVLSKDEKEILESNFKLAAAVAKEKSELLMRGPDGFKAFSDEVNNLAQSKEAEKIKAEQKAILEAKLEKDKLEAQEQLKKAQEKAKDELEKEKEKNKDLKEKAQSNQLSGPVKDENELQKSDRTAKNIEARQSHILEAESNLKVLQLQGKLADLGVGNRPTEQEVIDAKQKVEDLESELSTDRRENEQAQEQLKKAQEKAKEEPKAQPEPKVTVRTPEQTAQLRTTEKPILTAGAGDSETKDSNGNIFGGAIFFDTDGYMNLFDSSMDKIKNFRNVIDNNAAKVTKLDDLLVALSKDDAYKANLSDMAEDVDVNATVSFASKMSDGKYAIIMSSTPTAKTETVIEYSDGICVVIAAPSGEIWTENKDGKVLEKPLKDKKAIEEKYKTVFPSAEQIMGLNVKGKDIEVARDIKSLGQVVEQKKEETNSLLNVFKTFKPIDETLVEFNGSEKPTNITQNTVGFGGNKKNDRQK